MGPIDPALPRLCQQASSLQQQGQPAAAAPLWRQALNLDPNNAALYINLALCLKRSGQADEALALLQQGQQRCPPHPLLLSNLASLLLAANHATAALSYCQQALTLDPHCGPALANQASALAELGRWQAAIEAAQHCLELLPGCAEAHMAWGLGLQGIGEYEAARQQAEAALALNPLLHQAQSNLGNALRLLKRPTEALVALQRCVELAPAWPQGQVNLGIGLFESGAIGAAVEAYQRALALSPQLPEALANLAIALQELGSTEAAIHHYRQAIEQRPHYPEACFGLGTALLSQGHWQEGLALYDWRFQLQDQDLTIPPQGLRQADAALLQQPRQLLVVDEQGIGDTLQFCRYLPALAAQGHTVRFSVPAKLHHLLERAALQAELVGFPAPERAITASDAWIPLMSLPHLLHCNPAAPHPAYLQADPERVQHWQKRLRRRGRPLIGLSWQGNPAQEKLAGRSLPLEALAPLASLPQLDFLSLQRGPGEEQLHSCSFRARFIPEQEELSQIWAFEEIAAIMQSCDWIVSVDTATAHLAGGLGCPTWLLLKHTPEWRWGLAGDSLGTYPSLRLLRQRQPGNWAELVERLCVGLQAEVMA